MPNFQIPKTRFRRSVHVRRDINTSLAELRRAASLGLHLGAGSTRIEGLINCDLFDTHADQKIDARNLRGIQSNSVDLIEHHHMIEHLSFAEVEQALSEWYRVLRPAGYLLFTCPDIRAIAHLYLRYALFKDLKSREQKIDYAIRMFVGSQEHEGMYHKNHFDAERVRRLLPRYGFRVVFTYTPFPKRPTPSLFVVARKNSRSNHI